MDPRRIGPGEPVTYTHIRYARLRELLAQPDTQLVDEHHR